ncbi:MAG: PilZ domain-containing protein [Gammaproteobacteria bacterium]|nr:PilZ domain-containing protein [Gammaproteobacteria bacterium]NNJ91172.1 PilZ domain-containing protein [Gammaproteobacteria bacterium]
MKERRFAPRYRCDFTVAVEVEKQRYDFAAHNISATGLAVQVSQSAKQALAGFDMRLEVGDQLNLLLPTDDAGQPSVPARCQVQYVRRLSQEAWLMGCQFVDPDAGISQVIKGWTRRFESRQN